MKLRSFSHLSNEAVLRKLEAAVANERASTVEVIALIADVDGRRLHLEKGFSSMHAYCVQVLHFSEEAAFRRIRAARMAQQFPSIVDRLADGRLHLTAIVLLSDHLEPDNADELLKAVEHKTKRQIEWLLAERFPEPDVVTRVEVIAAPPALELTAASDGVCAANVQELPKSLSPATVGSPVPRARATPLSSERVAIQFSADVADYEEFRYVQALLGHQVAAGDIAAVYRCAVKVLKEKLEKQKLGPASRSHSGRQSSAADPRQIRPEVKRAVWLRDGAQCGFVSEDGHRCTATSRLEFDHVDPVARGGQATVDNIRLRCRAHNQYEAECVFGAGFMHEKREAAKHAVAARQAEKARSATPATTTDPDKDVIPWLRKLKVSAEEARRIAVLCEALPPETPLNKRVEFALRQLAPPPGTIVPRTAPRVAIAG